MDLRRAAAVPAVLSQLTMADGSPAKFGALRFPHVRQDAKWVAISSSYASDPEALARILREVWSLPEPSYLIDVTGAAAPLNDMDGTDQNVFRTGLLMTVRRTSAWLLSGGSNSGVMQLVGYAGTRTAPRLSSVPLLPVPSAH